MRHLLHFHSQWWTNMSSLQSHCICHYSQWNVPMDLKHNLSHVDAYTCIFRYCNYRCTMMFLFKIVLHVLFFLNMFIYIYTHIYICIYTHCIVYDIHRCIDIYIYWYIDTCGPICLEAFFNNATTHTTPDPLYIYIFTNHTPHTHTLIVSDLLLQLPCSFDTKSLFMDPNICCLHLNNNKAPYC